MKIDKEKNIFTYNGKEYPPTINNLQIFLKYRNCNSEEERLEIVKKLSNIVLDI